MLKKKRLQKIAYSWVLRLMAEKSGKFIIHNTNSTEKLLDVGCGDMILTKHVQSSGREVIGVDVLDHNLTNLNLVIYNGRNLPFNDKTFDVAYSVLVLHHLDDHHNLIKEMLRVSKKVIIIEDVYNNLFERFITCFKDWCYNHLESFRTPIPFNFCTDLEWRSTFNNFGLNVVDYSIISRYLITKNPRQIGYILERNNNIYPITDSYE